MKKVLTILSVFLMVLMLVPSSRVFALSQPVNPSPSVLVHQVQMIQSVPGYEDRVVNFYLKDPFPIFQDTGVTNSAGFKEYSIRSNSPYSIKWAYASNTSTWYNMVADNLIEGGYNNLTLAIKQITYSTFDINGLYTVVSPYPTQEQLNNGYSADGIYINYPRDNEIMMPDTIYEFKINFDYPLAISMNNYTITDRLKKFINSTLDDKIYDSLELYITDPEGNYYYLPYGDMYVDQNDYERVSFEQDYSIADRHGYITGVLKTPYQLKDGYELHARLKPYSSVNFYNNVITAIPLKVNSYEEHVYETSVEVNVLAPSAIVDGNGDSKQDGTGETILQPSEQTEIGQNVSISNEVVVNPILDQNGNPVAEEYTINVDGFGRVLTTLKDFAKNMTFITVVGEFVGQVFKWMPYDMYMVVVGTMSMMSAIIIINMIRKR